MVFHLLQKNSLIKNQGKKINSKWVRINFIQILLICIRKIAASNKKNGKMFNKYFSMFGYEKFNEL